MQHHMLVIGRSREIHAKVAKLGFRMSVIAAKAKLSTMDMTIYDRAVGLPVDAPLDEWVALARSIHAVDPVVAIGGLSETTQYIAAAVAEDLGLPYASSRTVLLSRDKYEMRQVLRERGIDTTASRVVSNAVGIENFAAEYGYPIVLKPRDGQGKMGFSLLRGADDVSPALARFEAQSPASDMLVEEFLEGDEYSVEAFSEEGEHRLICVTKKYKDPRTFVEIGHCVPASIAPETDRVLKDYAARVLDAIGVRNGPSHTEIMMGPEGPRIVETHVRLPGGAVVTLIDLLSSVDLDELWIRQLVGQSVLKEVPAELHGHAASAFAVPEGPGTLLRIEGEEQASEQPGVAEVRLIFEPGTEISDVYDSDSRGAGVLARGFTAQEAVARSRAALKLLKFQISRPEK
ncbi:ATP-grasp domain-containing protein [Streptomyces griseus]|uniref:ATP-grasp domain-containing protein n=1 Tax=Streptomyces griseus TaxID=1911 RepID=UPI000A62AC45|nr:ATP-grasp domain-containing protein [Streptomyces griseus]